MRNRFFTALFAALCAMCLLITGCQSARTKSAEQQIVPIDREVELAKKLSANLDKAYGAWDEPRVAEILNGLLTRLIDGAHVHLLATSTPLIAAGLAKTVYVSKGMLMSLQYENELAYLLSSQASLLKERVPARTLAHLHGQELGESIMVLPTNPPGIERDYLDKDWFEPGGLFDFGSEAYLKAEREGIRLAYQAKYDPRGAVNLVQRWYGPAEARHYRTLGKILPESEDQLRVAREEVAKLSPLRDPIVRGLAFEELQAELHIKKAKRKNRK